MSKAMDEIIQNLKDRQAQQPAFGAQIAAMAREAAKDVNNTLHQVFFGQPAGTNEPGTPLVPTQAMVHKELTG